MKRTSAAVLARVATQPAAAPAAARSAPPDAGSAGAPATDAVNALRARLAGSTARDHVVLDFLEDDLREARVALAAVAAYVANVEAALADPEPCREQLLALARGVGAADRVDHLQAALGSARRRLAQVAARM